MVIQTFHSRRQRGVMIMEVIVAMTLLIVAALPLGFALNSDARLFRVTYQKAVAMEIVDGEMEILAAGQWRSFPEGTNIYPVHAAAATNLPPGQFKFSRTGNHLQLEWRANPPLGGNVTREVTVQ